MFAKGFDEFKHPLLLLSHQKNFYRNFQSFQKLSFVAECILADIDLIALSASAHATKHRV